MSNKYLDFVSEIAEPDMTSRICIQIPAYCDSELIPTVTSFLMTAANPKRISFAICLQDDDMSKLAYIKSLSNCRVTHFSKNDAPGLCAARYECNQLIEDEEYVLHCDSHMRAAKCWDITLIRLLKECGDSKAILSGYPLDYEPYFRLISYDDTFTEKVPDDTALVSVFSRFDGDMPRFRGIFKHGVTSNIRGLFISGGCVFARSYLDKLCPSDPEMFFMADEFSMDIRYYTHGFNVYHPRFMPIWHLYGRTDGDTKAERFNTSDASCDIRREREKQRMKALLASSITSEFGIGTVRTVDDFLQHSGLDILHHTCQEFAKSGDFFAEREFL